MQTDKKIIKARIDELQQHHAELELLIEELMGKTLPDQLRIKRLKKEKLRHKDEIAKLEDLLFPDIIA